MKLSDYASGLDAFTKTELINKFGKLSDSQKQAVLLGASGVKIVMYDIEASHLQANIGRILCCSFKPLGEEVYTFSMLDRRFKRADVADDGALAAAIRDELERYDIIVGWNSKNFDTKYINARCMRAGERTKKAQKQVDGMWAWASKARAWKGLDAVQKFLMPDGEAKTPIAWDQWKRAMGWNKDLREQAMDEIETHCEADVRVLENVYRIMVEGNAIRSLRKDGGIL